jgi:hypothetical protein
MTTLTYLLRGLVPVPLACAALVGAQIAQAQTAAPAPVVPTLAATATSVEGTAYVLRADGRQSILARGSSLGVGDALSTTRNSTVRLRFTDGGETALRPESRLTVQAYSYNNDAPQSDNLVLSLLKGGLRAITGTIGKRGNVDAYKLNVRTVTVGIRGTDYTARLCENDCAPVVVAQNARPNSGPPVIARVMQVDRDSRQMELAQGGALYATDKVSTTSGGFAVLAFRDDTRLTLNSGTQLTLTQYSYDANQPNRGSMLFRLISGGLRVATGLIAKAAPGQVKFQTSTATVGIRGTVFDLACGKENAEENPPPADLTDLNCDNALFASTRVGEISLAGADGREIAVAPGQSALVPGANVSARVLANTPAFFGTIDTPTPESVPVNLEQQFGVAPPPANADGFFLMVREGKVVVAQAGQSLQLEAGESAFAGQSVAPVLISTPPVIIDRDPALSNTAFNFNVCRR